MDLASLTLRELTAGFNNVTDSALGQSSGKDAGIPTESTLRRCRTREQGQALLAISHAIEYLLDSRLIRQDKTTDAEREALAILMIANLSVYREGAEVVPFWSRLRRWFHGGTAKNKAANAIA